MIKKEIITIPSMHGLWYPDSNYTKITEYIDGKIKSIELKNNRNEVVYRVRNF